MKPCFSILTLAFFSLFYIPGIDAQQKKNLNITPAPAGYVSKVWVADQGDGTYKNPVLNADYSDPDAIRVGDDFYLIASSFDAVPGLPILHSKDLVNWKIIGHALKRQLPLDHFQKTQHGNGVWAPAIRYHKDEFYIYYPDPDFGIYLTKAKTITGPWTEPVLVAPGKGLIDPCPLWDADGRVYLAFAFAGSRAGIKSVIAVKQLNAEGNQAIDEGTIVYDGHEIDPTIEGPKFYKRNGYYYIFAPSGGVATGWQLVLRAKNIYGPYERKVVMSQGKSLVNGPHQGAWVNTQTGEDWFLHFQDKDAYGRVVHLQPMKWVNDWPVIGMDADGDGNGNPVMHYKNPSVGKVYPINTPAESDEFNNVGLGLQWQWQANPLTTYAFADAAKGSLKLYTQQIPAEAKNLWDVPNVLLQKFPADEFVATTKLTFNPNPKLENEKTGLVVMGLTYANIAIRSKKDGLQLVTVICEKADKGNAEKESLVTKLKTPTVYLRLTVQNGAKCKFSYSLDGERFIDSGLSFEASPGKWIGAKMGLFATREDQINDSGYADYDWFRVEALNLTF
ncbi:glycoside hydrolase 43 family protein [Pedobacter heparinus]|uniref:Glycoside hydrolase family 43 n=1 Tax=Pedobacter heparinus (strain ATCC 13125 / DSM 2366 / CIP 104194 / JCM 7457 / NBRC 12017 / NCIMB 9290 / NRRL B-14731 / HIM 762-3) TaxID=485917 RepID=C6Y3T9_PEDHD|nr:glycoside hydrolase 43 family protein [Pedobacter heparinus]ACU03368.1 glycoside hydrolase family 43 [Pedobacter heparinus DSM 2366]